MATQINIWVVLAILAIHWFADFVLQTDEQAKGKSKNWKDLVSHTFVYSLIWWVVGVVLIDVNIFHPYFEYTRWSLSIFVLLTFGFHTIQDYITSRLNSELWAEGKTHLFFVSIGFDQLLHFIQLLLTYQLLK
jgi:hypothetical protein